MTKFNFHGDLLEKGKQVITEATSEVEVVTEGVTVPTGKLEILPYQDGEHTHKQLKLSLSLPQGPKGDKGDTQALTSVVVETVPYGQNARGEITGTTLKL